MPDFRELRRLIEITRSEQIARRYLVTNGFDASLTMLGLVVGFRATEKSSPEIALAACFGTSVALAVSGFVSTYASESAEMQRDLHDLTRAMLDDLDESAHRRATRYVPILVAAVSGLSPFVVAQLIAAPLWLHRLAIPLALPTFEVSIAMALVVLFLFGALLGHVGRGGRIVAGLRLLAVGILTAVLIALAAPS